MISLSNVSFVYPGATHEVLKNVTLTIQQGEFIALIGNNGCGKSTLCKIINGLIPRFIQGTCSGEVLLEGQSTQGMKLVDLAKRIGYVYQDFENQIVKPKVWDEVAFAPMNFGLEDYQERARKALEEVGLDHLSEHYIWQLSGGQKHLVALASVLALGADILILDEPIAQLDPKHATLVYECLRRLNQSGKTIIVIEHHAEYIAKYCQQVVMMKAGQIVFKQPTRQALSDVKLLMDNDIFPPIVTQLVHSLNQEVQSRSHKQEIQLLPMNVDEAYQWLIDKKWIAKSIPIVMTKSVSGKSMPMQSMPMQSKYKTAQRIPMIDLRDIQLSFKGIKEDEVKVFKRLSLTLYRGEKIAIIGNNGAGKTTLLKMITGLIKPKYGDIYLSDQNITHQRPETIAQSIAYVYQNPEEMFIKDCIESDIAYGMKVRKLEHCDERTESLLQDYKLMPLKKKDGRLLSGGQMRRASLAIGVSLFPLVLLLDEPTANLDIGTRKEIHQTLKRLKDKTETVVIATHDMQLVSEWADRVLVLNQGEVIADGTVDEIFGNEDLIQRAGIEKPPLFHLSEKMMLNQPGHNVSDFVAYLTKEALSI